MIGVVTLQWNSVDHTTRFLNAISQHLDDNNLQLAFIDNGSDVQHIQQLKQKLKQEFLPTSNDNDAKVVLIENKHNSGFARACNVGIQYFLKTPVEWIWLLNNDTEIYPDSIEFLNKGLKDLQPGIYGTTILNALGEKETIAGYKFNLWTTYYRALSEKDFLNSEVAGLWYVSGASMIVHRNIFETCGLLDESTFLYFEELDFCQRAKSQGLRLDWLPDISIIHQGAGSSRAKTMKSKIMYHETWSTLYYYSKHHKYLFPYILIVRSFLRIFMLIIKKRFNEVCAVFSATKDFMLGRNKDLVEVEITDRNYYQ